MTRTVWLLFALVALTGCKVMDTTAFGASQEPLVVRSGTSFGMCIGYCVTELRVESERLVLTRTSRDEAKYPKQTETKELSREEWEAVTRLVEQSAFGMLEEAYGCPDCADGGAEWIEVERDGVQQRVTFEYGKSVAGIEELIAKLRELRARFG
jgi:hypothetical protein